MSKFGIIKLWCYMVHTLNICTSTLIYYELLTHHFLFSWMLLIEHGRQYLIDHMCKHFRHHRHYNDIINMKFGFQSDERMGY